MTRTRSEQPVQQRCEAQSLARLGQAIQNHDRVPACGSGDEPEGELTRLFSDIAPAGGEKLQQCVLHVGDALAADKGLPLVAQLIEHGFTLMHERVSALGHRQPCAPPVTRVGVAHHVTALFEERDRLRRRLLAHRGASPHLGHRHSTRFDGPQREIMCRTHSGVPAFGKSHRRFVRHDAESTEKQQCQIRSTSRHGSIISTTRLFNRFDYDNLVV